MLRLRLSTLWVTISLTAGISEGTNTEILPPLFQGRHLLGYEAKGNKFLEVPENSASVPGYQIRYFIKRRSSAVKKRVKDPDFKFVQVQETGEKI